MTELEKEGSLSLPLAHIIKAIDDLTKRAIPYQQTLLYAENLLPEYLECAYKTKLLITKTYSIAHNTATLYNGAGSAPGLRLANYNMEHFLNSAVGQIRDLYDNRNTEILIDCSPDCKRVFLDIRRTSLILFNLISNAVIHSGVKNKVITVSAKIEDNNFILSVKDNGNGVSKGRLDNLFSAYKDKLTVSEIKETAGGLFSSGTGLAVSEKAAEEMNGSLSHIPLSRGTKFQLVIPQAGNERVTESIDYTLSKSEIENYLADTLLLFILEDEENNK